MAVYLGDIGIGATLDHMFTTVDSSGGAVAMDSTCVVAVFHGNSTTPNSSGVTLNASFSTIVGLNHIRIVAASTSGYSSNTDNHIVIRTGNAGSKPLAGYMVGSFSIENRVHLRPTVNGRTLDVSAGGEAGVDWANVGSPTTALNLSGTNIDTDQVVASVTGAVGSVGAGGIAAASFAAGAIDASAIAANAIGASEIADGAIDAGAIAADAITAAKIADGAIDAATFAAGAINAAAIATGAIDADALAADAVDEILDDTIGDGTLTVRQALRICVAALAGKLSGAATTTVTIRNVADSADVVVATVDANGNRTATTVTP